MSNNEGMNARYRAISVDAEITYRELRDEGLTSHEVAAYGFAIVLAALNDDGHDFPTGAGVDIVRQFVDTLNVKGLP